MIPNVLATENWSNPFDHNSEKLFAFEFTVGFFDFVCDCLWFNNKSYKDTGKECYDWHQYTVA